MFLEALRQKMDKLAAKVPSVPKTPKVKTPNVTTPSTKMNVGKPPSIKMPKMQMPSVPKGEPINFASPKSTTQSADQQFFTPMVQPNFNPLDILKDMFPGG